ncbi:hypothetical protein NQ317_017239 [Molorchus minor]|uniref:Uncharacterized protein n=1 Tax=Molorchus minor TaxID=1323400 RepID=A0ABQ9J1C2_9CUCU|nr:hypothetical protein NQ317_017239 [Molorchus minor]
MGLFLCHACRYATETKTIGRIVWREGEDLSWYEVLQLTKTPIVKNPSDLRRDHDTRSNVFDHSIDRVEKTFQQPITTLDTRLKYVMFTRSSSLFDRNHSTGDELSSVLCFDQTYFNRVSSVVIRLNSFLLVQSNDRIQSIECPVPPPVPADGLLPQLQSNFTGKFNEFKRLERSNSVSLNVGNIVCQIIFEIIAYRKTTLQLLLQQYKLPQCLLPPMKIANCKESLSKQHNLVSRMVNSIICYVNDVNSIAKKLIKSILTCDSYQFRWSYPKEFKKFNLPGVGGAIDELYIIYGGAVLKEMIEVEEEVIQPSMQPSIVLILNVRIQSYGSVKMR